MPNRQPTLKFMFIQIQAVRMSANTATREPKPESVVDYSSQEQRLKCFMNNLSIFSLSVRSK
jgi:hypothetical protein